LNYCLRKKRIAKKKKEESKRYFHNLNSKLNIQINNKVTVKFLGS